MRHSFLSTLFLLGSQTLPSLAQSVEAQPPGVEGIDDPNVTKRLVHYWADYGCVSFSDGSGPTVKEQCKKACFPGGITSDVPAGQSVQSQTCWLSGEEFSWPAGLPLTEEEKKQNPRTIKTLTPGYCICNDPIINFAGDFFIQSVTKMGQVLQKVMCPTLMALDLVVEIGSAAIPGVGKAITVGMRTGVKTAKMFKHAYEAQDAAMEWASMFVDQGFGLASEAGCQTPFSFSKADLAKKFLDFANAPDALVPEINYDEMPCPKGKKASKSCKKKNGEDDEDDSPSKTKDNTQSTQTSNKQTQTSDKPTQTSDKPTQTSNQSSATSTNTGPTAKADCAAIGKNDMEALLEINPSIKEELVKKRAVGTTLQSRRLEARDLRPKRGKACAMDMSSKGYPSSEMKVMEGALAYGFNKINDCSDYSWGEQKAKNTGDYATDHVLEWSIVTNFFTTMKDHKAFKAGFDHPDPENNKKNIDFCTYWKESWDWPANLTMPNPDPSAPSSACKRRLQQTPLQWLAEAYPFIDEQTAPPRKAHEDEFILLQKRINGEAKNNMFSSNQIYNGKDMEDMIKRRSTKKRTAGTKKGQLAFGKPHEQPRTAIQRMRAVAGTYRYLKEKKVDAIFVAQVNRIGAQLEHLENALAKTPRTVERNDPQKGDGTTPKRVVTFKKWVPLKLKEKWFAYMDGVYENANKKGQDFMKEYLKKLKDEYNDKKMIQQKDVEKEKNKKKQEEMKLEKQLREDMKRYIPKLEAEWAKAKDWPKPKWNS